MDKQEMFYIMVDQHADDDLKKQIANKMLKKVLQCMEDGIDKQIDEYYAYDFQSHISEVSRKCIQQSIKKNYKLRTMLERVIDKRISGLYEDMIDKFLEAE